jgi:hypothetical protein
LFSLPVGTEMFHFPTFPPTALYIQAEVTGHDSSRVSPFGHPWITARLPAPQGFSQAPTSFIGFWCQGIHRVPLLTWPHKTRCSRPLCSSQVTGGSPGQCGADAGMPTQYNRGPGPDRNARAPEVIGRRSRRNGLPFPQDPTACQDTVLESHVPLPEGKY